MLLETEKYSGERIGSGFVAIQKDKEFYKHEKTTKEAKSVVSIIVSGDFLHKGTPGEHEAKGDD